MKNRCKIVPKTFRAVVLLFILISSVSLTAQPTFEEDVVDGIPLDGGLSLLIAGAVAYGIKKLRKSEFKSE